MDPPHNPDPNAEENRFTYKRFVITDEKKCDPGQIGEPLVREQGVEVILEVLHNCPGIPRGETLMQERSICIEQRIRPAIPNAPWFQRWHTGKVYLTVEELKQIMQALQGTSIGRITKEGLRISYNRDQLYAELRNVSALLQHMGPSPEAAGKVFKEYRQAVGVAESNRFLQMLASAVLSEIVDRFTGMFDEPELDSQDKL